jgi:hypothetical protein
LRSRFVLLYTLLLTMPRDGATLRPMSVSRFSRLSVTRADGASGTTWRGWRGSTVGTRIWPDLLAALVADCPKTRSFSIYDRCKAVYERQDNRAGANNNDPLVTAFIAAIVAVIAFLQWQTAREKVLPVLVPDHLREGTSISSVGAVWCWRVCRGHALHRPRFRTRRSHSRP